jgi:mannose-6-phosphate isomerase-like protein (cupin superfamily)
MSNRYLWAICFVLPVVVNVVVSRPVDSPIYLRRSVSQVGEKPDDLTAAKAHYRPIFGIGDYEARAVKGIARFGKLTVDPGGATKIVSYDREEQAYFVVKGSGTLLYDNEKASIKQNDFIYIPIGVKHGISNGSAEELHVIVMGYFIPEGKQVPATPKLMLANADDVGLQILGQHGPTTQFKLLMGNTRSMRDKLAVSQQITSLFIMDFAPGGTNIPHTHPIEEEIYYVLRGVGEMVAGGTAENEVRYPCKEGDAFYFPPKTLIGYYSGAREGQPHDLILAVRSPYPSPATPRPAD